MSRTTESAVKGILLADYDSEANHDLEPFIETASILVDSLDSCSQAKGIILTVEELEMIERWIAAHCYKASDPAWLEVTTGDARAKRQGDTGMYLESTFYGQTAINMDRSGCLADIQTDAESEEDTPAECTGQWLGLPRSQRTPIWDRNR